MVPRALRRRPVRVVVYAVIISAVGFVVAVALAAWTVAAFLASGVVGLTTLLAVLLARRHERMLEASRVDTLRAVGQLREELVRESAKWAEVDALRTSLDRVEGALDTVTSNQSLAASDFTRLLAAVEKIDESQAEAKRRIETQFAQFHSALMTDAQALHQLMHRFQPVEPLPAVAGWALDPSGLLWLTRHVAHSKPGLIVECGSGTSTLWIAMALREVGQGRLVALEHEPKFAELTRTTLARHGLSDWVDVVDAPLSSTETPRGRYNWYSLDSAISEPIDLLIVDGPPRRVGKHARYPALPVLIDALADGATIIVDDMHRRDEREIVDFWLNEQQGLTHQATVSAHSVALKYATASGAPNESKTN